MSTVEKNVDVNVPVRVAYDQWTQFEDVPKFMEGVRRVDQLGDRGTHWCVEIGGKTEEYDAQITEQVPDQRIAWRSTSGPKNSGLVFVPSPGRQPDPGDAANGIRARASWRMPAT